MKLLLDLPRVWWGLLLASLLLPELVLGKPAPQPVPVTRRPPPLISAPAPANRLAGLPRDADSSIADPTVDPQLAASWRPPVRTSTAAGIPILDPNVTGYPRTSLHDFSDLCEAPAGRHGFLQVRGDHFVWKDGSRARFWGINVANTSLQEPDADIDAIIANFRTAGFNLIRLHHFDERGGILDENAADSRQFVAERLRKLDYWIFRARQAGIYVYLDLLDYRHFKDGDDVPAAAKLGRAARPYAVFNRRLIELQKEYARKLLREHVNPYTGLSYADDPAVVMLEIYDESGLFMRRYLWRQMPEPYATEFRGMWNEWLRHQYGTTGTLAASWTSPDGLCALRPDENLEKGTVEVPAMSWTPEKLPLAEQAYASQVRQNDGARFAYSVHLAYFHEMKQFLDSIGVRIPVTATGRFEDLVDLRSVASELDFIGANFYYDHPYWAADKPSWQPPSFFHNHNPITDVDDRSMAAACSLARIHGKPFVVREWNYCWPNQNRAAGMLEAACFAALHDVDAMILFVYETRPTARVSYFNVRSDPARWGLCGIGAEIFLKHLIAPSQHKIVVPYSPVDLFTYSKYHQPFYALGWATRLENDFFDGGTYQCPPQQRTDLILNPGRSGVGEYRGAPAVLHCEDLRRDLAGHLGDAPEYLATYGLTPQPCNLTSLTYDGLLYNDGIVRDSKMEVGLPLQPLVAAGSRAIGYNVARGVANGFLDEKNRRLIFGSLGPEDVLRAALDAMELFYQVRPMHVDASAHEAAEQNVFWTDTGEILRDSGNGRLVVSASQVQALCGNLSGVGRVPAPGLRVRNLRTGVLVAMALDGLPLVDSHHYVIKMVTDARNLDELAGRDSRFRNVRGGQWRCNQLGRGPVVTLGRPSQDPIRIAIENRPVLDVYLKGGSFELLVDGNRRQFYCDTPGTRFALPPQGARWPDLAQGPGNTTLECLNLDGTSQAFQDEGTNGNQGGKYPLEAALIRVTR